MPTKKTDSYDKHLLLTLIKVIAPKVTAAQWQEAAKAMNDGSTDSGIR